MTVVAWDGKTLAVDRKCSGSKTTTTKKLFEHNGERIAICGNLSTAMALLSWYVSGKDPDTFKWADNEETLLIVVDKEGDVLCFLDEPVPFILTSPFEAWGSGGDVARAAMYLGHDAIKAVEVACALDDGCGNGIDWM